MTIKTTTIKGYSCPNKVLISINDEPVVFCNSMKRAGKIVEFLEGYRDSLGDKAIERLLKKYINK